MKSEPDVFSIEDLKRKGTSGWDGVRNYQARNYIRTMKKGDHALFYHSNAKPAAIVGTMTIAREAYADPTQFDRKSEYYDPKSTPQNPRWFQVDVQFESHFPLPISLEDVKQTPALKNMVLVKNSRLSVQPVAPAEWRHITSWAFRSETPGAKDF